MPRRLLLLVASCAFFCSSRLLSAEEKIPAERVVPSKSILFVSIPDFQELRTRYEDSIFATFWNDPELKILRDALSEQWDEFARELKTETGLVAEDLLSLPQGEIAVAISRAGRGKIGWAALIDFGDQEDVVDDVLAAAEKALQENDFQRESREVEGTRITFFSLGNTQFGWFTRDGFLAIGMEIEVLASLLVRWDGKHDDVLAERDVYQQVMNRCWRGEEEPAVRWFVDPMLFVQTLVESSENAFQQATVMAMLPQLGVDRIRGVGGTLDIATEKYELVNESLFIIEPPIGGVLQMLRGDAVVQPVPSWVRADAIGFHSINWDLAGAYESARTMVDLFQGPGALDRIIEELADDEAGPKIHFKKDLVDNLTGQIQMAVGADDTDEDELLSESLEISPNTVIALTLRDSRRMQDLLESLGRLEGSPLAARTFQGQSIYEFHVGASPFRPGFAIAEGRLFFSPKSQRLEEVLRGGEGHPRLRDSAALRRLQSEAPEQVSVWGVERLGPQLQRDISQLLSMLTGNRRVLNDDPLADFDAEAFSKKYPLDRLYYIVPDPRGAYWKDYIPRRAP